MRGLGVRFMGRCDDALRSGHGFDRVRRDPAGHALEGFTLDHEVRTGRAHQYGGRQIILD